MSIKTDLKLMLVDILADGLSDELYLEVKKLFPVVEQLQEPVTLRPMSEPPTTIRKVLIYISPNEAISGYYEESTPMQPYWNGMMYTDQGEYQECGLHEPDYLLGWTELPAIQAPDFGEQES